MNLGSDFLHMNLNLEIKQYISIEVKLFCSLMVILHGTPTVFSAKSKVNGDNVLNGISSQACVSVYRCV